MVLVAIAGAVAEQRGLEPKRTEPGDPDAPPDDQPVREVDGDDRAAPAIEEGEEAIRGRVPDDEVTRREPDEHEPQDAHHERGRLVPVLEAVVVDDGVADGDLPLELQAKLLRVLEEGEIRRVGGREPRKVDVRVIAATAKPLEQAVDRLMALYRQPDVWRRVMRRAMAEDFAWDKAAAQINAGVKGKKMADVAAGRYGSAGYCTSTRSTTKTSVSPGAMPESGRGLSP